MSSKATILGLVGLLALSELAEFKPLSIAVLGVVLGLLITGAYTWYRNGNGDGKRG
ncbi:MAG: hypothetical protein QNJ62_06155 [Methyloceanibacter sp.]|nr:hypothetical protein [Methyloceanibacter sp.]